MPNKLSANELKLLLKASYDEKLVDVGDKFLIDKSLSGTRVKVFTVKDSNDVVVTHRGSQNVYDWLDNVELARGNDISTSSTYKIHLQKHKDAVSKYGKANIISIGHSRGGAVAAELHKKGLSAVNVNVNMPTNIMDRLFDNDHDATQVNIRSENDPASIVAKILPGKPNDIVIPSKSLNPITEHKSDVLGRLNPEQLIGAGKKKKDFSKMLVHDLKDFIKTNKKKFNRKINVTGLTKEQLIAIVETLP